MSFQDLNLHPEILKAIEGLGHTVPTPIQLEAIPKILEGCDMRGSSKTGSGKTAAFLLPVIHKLATPSALPGRGPRALILVPTRELAIQVAAEANKYTKYLSRVKTVCIYGGAPYPIQNRELSRPYEILIATPGRLMDHMERGKIDFSRLEVLILDEADRMLDMGFIEPVEHIAAATPANRQTLLFSATLKGSVMSLSKRLLKNPVEINVAATEIEHQNITQSVYQVDGLDHKNQLLEHLLIDDAVTQVIIFTATKHHADQLKEELRQMGHSAAALHGDMSQGQRNRTINDLRKGNIRILVATDVAARGIDIPTISHIINFDLPNSAEDYVHRIGRTGRAGATGIALSFASSKDFGVVKRIEQFTGNKIPMQVIAGMEPKKRAFGSGYSSDSGSRRPRSSGSSAPRGGFSRGNASSDRRSFSNDRPPRERTFAPRTRESNRNDGDRDGNVETGEKSFSRPRPRRPEGSERPFQPREKSFGGEQSFAEGAYRPSPKARAVSNDRPQNRDRPPFGDRPPRGDRPPFGDRAPRGDRPPFGDRAPRADRPTSGERSERAPAKKKAFFGEGPRGGKGSFAPAGRTFSRGKPPFASKERAPRRSPQAFD